MYVCQKIMVRVPTYFIPSFSRGRTTSQKTKYSFGFLEKTHGPLFTNHTVFVRTSRSVEEEDQVVEVGGTDPTSPRPHLFCCPTLPEIEHRVNSFCMEKPVFAH